MEGLLEKLLEVDIGSEKDSKNIKPVKPKSEGRVPSEIDTDENKIKALIEEDEKLEKNEEKEKDDKKKEVGEVKYFGSKGDQHYYLVENEGKYLVQDQDKKEVFATDKDFQGDVLEFIVLAFNEITPENVSYDLFMKYVYPKLVKEKQEEKELRKEEVEEEEFTKEEVEEAKAKVSKVLADIIEKKKSKGKDKKKEDKNVKGKVKESKKLEAAAIIYAKRKLGVGDSYHITTLNESKGIFLLASEQFTGKLQVSEVAEEDGYNVEVIKEAKKESE